MMPSDLSSTQRRQVNAKIAKRIIIIYCINFRHLKFFDLLTLPHMG